MRGCLKMPFWYGGVKKWKSWKSNERVGNEINSITVLVGNLPHIMHISFPKSMFMPVFSTLYNFRTLSLKYFFKYFKKKAVTYEFLKLEL